MADRPEPLYWGLDPLFHVHVKLLAATWHGMVDATPGGDICWLGTHPVRYVEAAGVVVSVHVRSGPRGPTEFILDDGTGLVTCTLWHDAPGAAPPPALAAADEDVVDASGLAVPQAARAGRATAQAAVRLGAMMRARGRPTRFREKRQLSIDAEWGEVWAETDSMAQCWHWIEARRLWEGTYSHASTDPRMRPTTDAAPAAAGNAVAGAAGVASGEAQEATCARLLAAATRLCADPRRLAPGEGATSVQLAREASLQGRCPPAELDAALARLVEASALYQVDRGRYRVLQ